MPKHFLEYDPTNPADVHKAIAHLELFLPKEKPAPAPAPAQRTNRAPGKPKASPPAPAKPPADPAKYAESLSWSQAVKILRKKHLAPELIVRLHDNLFAYAAEVGINLDEKKLFLGQLADKRLVEHKVPNTGKHYPKGLLSYPNTSRKQNDAFKFLVRYLGVEPGSTPPGWQPPQ